MARDTAELALWAFLSVAFMALLCAWTFAIIDWLWSFWLPPIGATFWQVYAVSFLCNGAWEVFTWRRRDRRRPR